MSTLTRLAQENPDAADTLRQTARLCWVRLNSGQIPPYSETLAKPNDPTPTYDETAYALGYSPFTLRNEHDVAKWKQVVEERQNHALARIGIPARPLSYQAHARRTDPQTSHEAARTVTNITQVHKHILTLLSVFTNTQRHPHGLTDEDIRFWWADQYPEHPISESGLRTRRRELVDAGRVVDSGEKGRTAAGRSTIIWRLA